VVKSCIVGSLLVPPVASKFSSINSGLVLLMVSFSVIC